MCMKEKVRVLMLNYAKLSQKMFISEEIGKFDFIDTIDFKKK